MAEPPATRTAPDAARPGRATINDPPRPGTASSLTLELSAAAGVDVTVAGPCNHRVLDGPGCAPVARIAAAPRLRHREVCLALLRRGRPAGTRAGCPYHECRDAGDPGLVPSRRRRRNVGSVANADRERLLRGDGPRSGSIDSTAAGACPAADAAGASPAPWRDPVRRRVMRHGLGSPAVPVRVGIGSCGT